MRLGRYWLIGLNLFRKILTIFLLRQPGETDFAPPGGSHLGSHRRLTPLRAAGAGAFVSAVAAIRSRDSFPIDSSFLGCYNPSRPSFLCRYISKIWNILFGGKARRAIVATSWRFGIGEVCGLVCLGPSCLGSRVGLRKFKGRKSDSMRAGRLMNNRDLMMISWWRCPGKAEAQKENEMMMEKIWESEFFLHCICSLMN